MTQALGIDISKDTFDVCLLTEGKSVQAKFDNNHSGFEKLVRWLRKLKAQGVHACMEATGQYGDGLAEFLYASGLEVSVVNPARIKAYAKSKMRRNKTDKADAELIALFCEREKPGLWSPPPPSFKKLQALVRYYDNVLLTCLQEKNRLKSGLSEDSVISKIKDHITYLENLLDTILSDIQNHIDANPDLKHQQDLLISIPGIGKLTAAKVLGEVRDISDFDNPRQLAAYVGVTPSNQLSGTSVHKKAHMSKMGNAKLRHALYMPAICAKNRNPIVKVFADRLLNAGLAPMQVIGVIMRKLLHIIYGILKSGRPFDPNFLIQAG